MVTRLVGVVFTAGQSSTGTGFRWLLWEGQALTSFTCQAGMRGIAGSVPARDRSAGWQRSIASLRGIRSPSADRISDC